MIRGEIVHHEGQFVIWSSICDTVSTGVMTEDELWRLLCEDAGLHIDQTHSNWGPLALADYEKDQQAEEAKIERRIARAKKNGASGFRWYDEVYTGELCNDFEGGKMLSPKEIIEYAKSKEVKL